MTTINPLTAPTPAPLAGRGTPRIADARVRMAVTLLPLALIVLVAAFGPLFVPYDPERVAGAVSHAPTAEHLFGTDSSGMDVFTRTIVATRVNVAVAAAVAVLCTAVGVLCGLLIGMNESGGGVIGYAARLAARGVDLVQAVPSVLLGLVIVAFFGTTPSTLVLALAIVLTPLQLRLVRTEVLRVRGDAYVDAARQAGMSEVQLTFRHVLPNSTWAAVENISVMFGIAILLTSALGFLGAGLPPPTPEWGYMIAEGGSDAAVGRWWAALMPTVAVVLTVSAVAWSGARLWGPNRTGRSTAD
jgi:peptide/nickel transport system permease protein